jgi:membrane protein YdbS with pleckstrin-like domain
MVEQLKSILLPLLKVPEKPPAPPPGHHAGEFLKTFRACPSYLHYRLLGWVLYAAGWAVGVGALVVFLLFALPVWGLLFVIPLVLFAVVKAGILYVTTVLDYEMRWYILTERSLRLREGVWIVRELTLTYANVQNVSVLQGPIQRLFGFSDIMLQTAGGGAGQKEQRLHDPHKAVLRGIENPTEVRDLILNLLRRYRTAGLGDREERVEGPGRGAGALSRELLAEIRDEARALHEAIARSKTGV